MSSRPGASGVSAGSGDVPQPAGPASHHAVRLDAELDRGTSRALWLVKWLLLIPHYLVLALLWPALLVTTVIAFFAILATRRYPSVLFDFNVGVLRWSWRVSYYGYGVLGTDRYPPFTLHDVPDYPTHLEVERPGQLSRVQVLTKWWLLAIPHYLVVGILLGGVAGYDSTGTDGAWVSGPGLIGLLVLVAGVLLLFTGRYPRQLFDLVLGLNRWVYRVVAYAALMTDRYPPFALDQGGPEPGPPTFGTETATGTVTPPATTAPASTAAPHHPSGWTAGRVVGLVVGSVLLLLSLGLAGTAGGVAWVDGEERRADGYVMSDELELATPRAVVTSESLQWHTDVPGDRLPSRFLGDTRVVVAPGVGGDVFVGVGPSDAVEDFLDGVAHDVVVGVRGDRAVLRSQAGADVSPSPADQGFWVASGTGPGPVEVTWRPTDGDWTWVVMNVDSTPRIEAEVRVGAELPELDTLAGVLLGLAALGFLLGLALVVTAVVLASRDREAHP